MPHLFHRVEDVHASRDSEKRMDEHEVEERRNSRWSWDDDGADVILHI